MERIRGASWQSRFWAWLIDVLLLSIPWHLIMYAFGLDAISFLGLGCYGAMAFFYWTVLEGYRGQSMGKMVLNLAVIGKLGECIGFKEAAIESFGKAFLLPLDCLVGWTALPGSGQRLFNKISDTVVASLNQEDACIFMNRKK